MTTEAPQTEAAAAEKAAVDGGYMQVPIPGIAYSAVRIPWDADFAWYAQQMRLLRDCLDAEFGPPDAQPETSSAPPPRPPARPPTAGRNGPPSGPSSRPAARGGPPARRTAPQQANPDFPNDACDICGGPAELVERRQTRDGNWVSASLRCAGRCKDKGKYPHTIRWLNDDEMDALGL